MSELREIPGIPELITKHSLSIFIETGCDRGAGLFYAQELGIPNRLSCDIRPESVKNGEPYGTVLLSDSREFITMMAGFPLGTPPCLFWLDAHVPEIYGAQGEFWPLGDELRILSKKAGIAKDVIICDDMQFIPDEHNPTFNPGSMDQLLIGIAAIKGEAPGSRGPEYQKLYEIFKSHDLTEILGLYPNHKANWLQVGQGILILEPKED